MNDEMLTQLKKRIRNRLNNAEKKVNELKNNEQYQRAYHQWLTKYTTFLSILNLIDELESKYKFK